MSFDLQYGMLCDSHTRERGEKLAKCLPENAKTAHIGVDGTATDVPVTLTEVTCRIRGQSLKTGRDHEIPNSNHRPTSILLQVIKR